jgi:predicted nuclease of predicted toxin-antitoxin system
MKFLIDECLSPELTKLAQQQGYGASTHVAWLGRAALKDWNLKPLILEGDWTFVTKNSVDFRGPADKPGTKGPREPGSRDHLGCGWPGGSPLSPPGG